MQEEAVEGYEIFRNIYSTSSLGALILNNGRSSVKQRGKKKKSIFVSRRFKLWHSNVGKRDSSCCSYGTLEIHQWDHHKTAVSKRPLLWWTKFERAVQLHCTSSSEHHWTLRGEKYDQIIMTKVSRTQSEQKSILKTHNVKACSYCSLVFLYFAYKRWSTLRFQHGVWSEMLFCSPLL